MISRCEIFNRTFYLSVTRYFLDNLCMKLPTNMDELKAQVAGFIQVGEMAKFRAMFNV